MITIEPPSHAYVCQTCILSIPIIVKTKQAKIFCNCKCSNVNVWTFTFELSLNDRKFTITCLSK